MGRRQRRYGKASRVPEHDTDQAGKEVSTKMANGPDAGGQRQGSLLYGMVGALAIAVVVSVVWRVSGDSEGIGQAAAMEAGLPHRGMIVVVDSKAALQAYMDALEQQVLAGADMTEAQLHMRGAEFGAEFVRAVRAYQERGYIVIDRNQVLTAPPEVDITQEIAGALGLEIQQDDDPFTVPKGR